MPQIIIARPTTSMTSRELDTLRLLARTENPKSSNGPGPARASRRRYSRAKQATFCPTSWNTPSASASRTAERGVSPRAVGDHRRLSAQAERAADDFDRTQAGPQVAADPRLRGRGSHEPLPLGQFAQVAAEVGGLLRVVHDAAHLNLVHREDHRRGAA